MSRREKRVEKTNNKVFSKIIIVILFLLFVLLVLKYARNYLRDDVVGKTNLVVNHSNVTTSLKKDVLVENGITYISKEDISNFFDPYIYYDEKYNQIITGSENKIASIVVGEKKMTNNGSVVTITGTVLKKDGTYYIPFSNLDSIYNVKTTYIQETDTVVVDSLNKKFVVADSNKKTGVKYKQTSISRDVDKVQKGENIVVLDDSNENGWVKIRTARGKIGYIKDKVVVNKIEIRDNMSTAKKIDGKISMIWDYFSQYGSAPARNGKLKGVNVVSPTFFTLERLGKGKVIENVGESGKQYIKWAHDNGYKVWPSISNDSMIDTTSEIMNDYKLRQDLIEKIVSFIVKYELDGINIDFENMYEKDKNLFSRFLIELSPRLKEIGAVLSVDVTAPDGSSTWSMCYNRNLIGKIADYIVFMAYDQNGISSPKEGTTAGCDWVETNIQKFIGTQEGIDSNKVILGVPFYTRVWWRNSSGKVKSEAVNMKNLDSIIPSNATKTWDDKLKQYVAEYTKNGIKYKVWIEDEKSMDAKLSLINTYNLAGAAYWQKGGEPDNIWNLVTDKLGVN